MYSKKIKLIVSIHIAILIILGIHTVSAGQSKTQVICENNLISVTAKNAEPETLFNAFAAQCGIKIVIHGNEFPEKEINLEFNELTAKDGVTMLVRACGLKNYMMDLRTDEKTGEKKVVKLDLFVGGGGTRVITGTDIVAQDETERQPDTPEYARIKALANQIDASGKLRNKTSFADDGIFSWDGTAMIDFPEFKGELPYDKSTYKWEPQAKEFSKKTMNIVPPAVRDIVSDLLIRTCDEIAREQASDEITPEITSEALQVIGKSFNLPPDVINIMPKKLDDFNEPKIDLEPEELREEYR